MEWEDVKLFSLVTGGVIVFVVAMGLSIQISLQLWALHFQPQEIVRVDGKEIFRGSNACIDESSLGATTHIQIMIGPLCLFPGPKYTSKNVHLEPILNPSSGPR